MTTAIEKYFKLCTWRSPLEFCSVRGFPRRILTLKISRSRSFAHRTGQWHSSVVSRQRQCNAPRLGRGARNCTESSLACSLLLQTRRKRIHIHNHRKRWNHPWAAPCVRVFLAYHLFAPSFDTYHTIFARTLPGSSLLPQFYFKFIIIL